MRPNFLMLLPVLALAAPAPASAQATGRADLKVNLPAVTSVNRNAPESISFGPATLAVAPGGSLFFVATAHFSDGRSEVITRQGSWVSLSPSVATAGAADGVVVGVADSRINSDPRTSSKLFCGSA